MPVSRFAPLAGIAERTYRRRLARLRGGEPVKRPWPSPQVDAWEALAAKYATDWPAWGHRKIAAMMRADGHAGVSTSTVERACADEAYQHRAGSARTAGPGRRSVGVCATTTHPAGQVWQTDFTEFEASSGGICRICAVIDYATQHCLAITIGATSRGRDAWTACAGS